MEKQKCWPIFLLVLVLSKDSKTISESSPLPDNWRNRISSCFTFCRSFAEVKVSLQGLQQKSCTETDPKCIFPHLHSIFCSKLLRKGSLYLVFRIWIVLGRGKVVATSDPGKSVCGPLNIYISSCTKRKCLLDFFFQSTLIGYLIDGLGFIITWLL